LNKSYYPAEENNAAIGSFLRYWLRGYETGPVIGAPTIIPPTRIFNGNINSDILHDLTGEWPGVFQSRQSVQYLMWRDTNLHTIYELMFEALTRPLGSTRGGMKRKSRKAKRKSRKN